MAKAPDWTKAEEKKLIAIAKKAKTVDEALALVRALYPERNLSKPAMMQKYYRLGIRISEVTAANRSTVAKDDAAGELARFVAVAKKGGTLEDVCDRLDLAPKRAKAMIDAAKKAGYRIELAHGQVGYVPSKPLVGERRIVAQPGEEHVFAVASDIHVGSKYFLGEQFVDFVTRAYKEDGVRTIFGPGDILDGVYRHSRWEESHHGFHEQATFAAKVFPRLPGLRYVMIAGNHDETFEKESGLDVSRAIEDVFRREGRDDLTMLGARGAYVRYAPKGGRGILVELWHPLGGGAYAVSYKLQRHVEEYGVGQKPDFMFAGHWHQQCYVVRRGVHCFSSGTFHGGGSSFGKALGGAQAIGGWVVRFRQTREGTVRDVAPTWRGYYETESIRELGLG